MATTTVPTIPTAPTVTDAPAAPATPATPGWKTSEHALSVLAIVMTALYAANIIPTDSVYGKVAAIAATVLTALGYTVVRGQVKFAASFQAAPSATRN